ncbi:Tim44/TimA family putative adaptor protein [Thalassobaculum sp.]|uniref:Tim44/TimA family putative adaptor protein n=1 Tax=Thalassobaculum sp. TaxID=2022740 RepID=UPI0032EA96A7
MGIGVPFLDIILLALFAGFVIFKLRSVLGRRTGHERQRPDPFAEPPKSNDNGNIVRLPDRSAEADEAEGAEEPGSMAAGIMRIKLADERFDEREFLHGAKMAFAMIVEAFAKGDVDALKPLLSRELFGGFAAAIEGREKAGETQETTIVTVRSADIVEATLEDHQAKVTVEFVSEQVKVTRNADGEVTEGDPDRIDILTDIWTFARDIRSRDPNWALVATRVPED